MDRRGAYKVLVGKTERKRTLGITTYRGRYNIKTYIQEVGWVVKDWLDLAQDREVAGFCKRGNEPSDSIIWGNFLTS